MSKGLRGVLSVLLLLLILLTLGFIWGNSMLDRDSSSGVSNSLLERLRPFLSFFGFEPESDHLLRKLAHFCEFGLLGVELTVFVRLRSGKTMKGLGFVPFICLQAAAADEVIQHYSGRASRLSDVLLDFSGSLCGIAGVCLLVWLWQRRATDKK